MEATAFCPAHITGFFKAYADDGQRLSEICGSVGAGFSIREGVTTHVKIVPRTNQKNNFQVTIHGYQTDKTDVTEFVVGEILKRGDFEGLFLEITHNITIPIGFGLGSSGAVALSLAFALNKALRAGLSQDEVGRIAHNAEVHCKTGLGDVLASYHGGFEIRTKPGAPGIGRLEKINTGQLSIIMICFSPISTNKFISKHLPKINGIGGRMVSSLLKTRDSGHFQDMSLEFAKRIKVVTPKMEGVIKKLSSYDIKCGVALFGETIFSMIPDEKSKTVLEILEKYSDGVIIRSELDWQGARILN